MKRITCLVWVLLLTATSCGVTRSTATGNDIHYALAFVNFEGGKGTLLISALDGSKVSSLSARFPELSTDIYWSPDGKRIAFVSDQDGNREIYVVDLDTLSPVNLTRNLAADIAPSWSPNGQFIAFVSDRHYCPIDDLGLPDASCIFWHGELYVMKHDGTDVRRVTYTEISECGARWWPDSKRLIYSAPCSLTVDERVEIYTVDLADGLLTQLTDSSMVSTPLGLHNTDPIPSPDGRYILFHSSFQDANVDLYLMNADGSDPIRLTNTPGVELSAGWSPDGAFIAWNHNQEILVMNVETREVIRTGTKDLSACRARWSPCGEKIAFVANCGIGDSGPHDTIYVMNRDGSNKVNVTPDLGSQPHFGLLRWVPIEWLEVGIPLTLTE